MPETANSTDFQTSLTNKCVQTQIQSVSQTRRRWMEWAKLIALTGSAQVMVQAIGFISGILVIRLLPTHEYALYTLANTMLGTMTLLADGGISTGVMSQGGKVWQDKQKLGATLVTGMQLRKKFAVLSLLVATPILFYLLRKHDASWLMSTLIALSLIPAFFTNLSGTLLEIAPKLHQDIKPLQKIQVVANVGRLVLLGLTLFVYPFAAVAIACAGGSQIWSNWRLRKLSSSYADRSEPANAAVLKEILSIVKRMMPGAIYYCLSGQVTVWLISLFGSTESIAQIGALGRLAMLINICSVIFGTLVIPRFARLPNNQNTLLRHFISIQAVILFLSMGIVIAVIQFPQEVLLILGKNYSTLTTEVVLITASSVTAFVVASNFSLSLSRGWVMHPAINIPINVGILIILILYIDFSSVVGVILFSFANQIIQYFLWLVFIGYKIKRL